MSSPRTSVRTTMTRSKNYQGIDGRSLDANHRRVPNYVFAGIHLSFTAWSPPGDSAARLRPAPAAGLFFRQS